MPYLFFKSSYYLKVFYSQEQMNTVAGEALNCFTFTRSSSSILLLSAMHLASQRNNEAI